MKPASTSPGRIWLATCSKGLVAWPCLVLLFTFSSQVSAFQMTEESGALKMLTILSNYRTGAAEQASLDWQHLAQDIVLVAKADDVGLQQLAGLSFVLASYGWDRLDDARALHSWQAALETYLGIGMVWEAVVARRMAALDNIEQNLAGLSPGDQNLVSAPVQLDVVNLLWIELEKHLSISTYFGPESQLSAVDAGQNAAPGLDRPSAPTPYLDSSSASQSSEAGTADLNDTENAVQPILPNRGGAGEDATQTASPDASTQGGGEITADPTSAAMDSGRIYREPSQAFLDEIENELGETSQTGNQLDGDLAGEGATTSGDAVLRHTGSGPLRGRADGDLDGFYGVPPNAENQSLATQ